MRKALFLVAILLSFILGACKDSNTAEGGIQNKEVKSIIPKHKYALLIVESKSCIYCAQLKKDLKTEPKIKEALKGMDLYFLLYESYKPVKTNIGGQVRKLSEKELAKALRATSFPNLIFYDKNGNIILQIPGYLPPEKFVCVIDYVKTESFKNTPFEQYMKRCG